MEKSLEDFVKWRDQSDRLRLLQEDFASKNQNYWTDHVFADFLGVTKSSFSNMAAGTRLSLENAIQVCEVAGCSLDWFVLGIGERYAPPVRKADMGFNEVKAASERLSPGEQIVLAQSLLEMLRSLVAE